MLTTQDFITDLRRDLADTGHATRLFDNSTMLSWRNPREPNGLTHLVTVRLNPSNTAEIVVMRFLPLGTYDDTTATTRVFAMTDELARLQPWIASGMSLLPCPVAMRRVERKTLLLGWTHEAWLVYHTERYATSQTGERVSPRRRAMPSAREPVLATA